MAASDGKRRKMKHSVATTLVEEEKKCLFELAL